MEPQEDFQSAMDVYRTLVAEQINSDAEWIKQINRDTESRVLEGAKESADEQED